MALVKVKRPITKIDQCDSFMVFGDPGCDGLGADIMSIFAKALTAAEANFCVILGDVAPVGHDADYTAVTEFIDLVAPFPVYCLNGNHDSPKYSKYFGLKNYALVNDDILFIMLDNSSRKIETSALKFLRKTLAAHQRDTILLMLHIPPPNSYTANSMNAAEWGKVRSIYKPYKDKIKYILCGHVHTYFEDEVDGIPVIVSGGAGARLEYVSDKVDKTKAFHHVLRFNYDKRRGLTFEHITLDGRIYGKELADHTLKKLLTEAFQKESASYIKYSLFAEDAREKARSGLEKLFKTAAHSAFIEARNHCQQLNLLNGVGLNLERSYKKTIVPGMAMYKECLDYAVAHNLGLAKYTFYEAHKAITAQKEMFEHAIEELKGQKDIYSPNYFTCTSCGYTIKSKVKPLNCPICGAPFDKLHEVS